MGKKKKEIEALEEVSLKQIKDGSFSQSKTSITRSSGKSLVIETSSLALLAMLRIDNIRWSNSIKKTVDFLISSMNGGYFGSTQATILAMKALVEYMNLNKNSGQIELFEVIVNMNKHLMKVGDQMKFPDESNSYFFRQ